jgi:hypothetical protein
MYERFERLLRRRDQRFVCTDDLWPVPSPARHVARIEHDVGPPVDAATLDAVAARVGNLPEVIEFYRRCGAARLFRDTIAVESIGYDSAYYIAPPEAWPDLRECFAPWLDGLSDEERAELLPTWLDDYVVIGEGPHSGNYFLLPLVGPARGRIVEFEHDGFEFIERAPNLADFLDSLATVTDARLEEIRGHTRYADGKTPTQWLCLQYLHDDES